MKGLSLGAWSSYTLSNQTTNTDEIDLYLGYALETDAGEFSLLLTDYYYPNAGKNIQQLRC